MAEHICGPHCITTPAQALAAHKALVNHDEALCANTIGGRACIWKDGHGGTEHEAADGTRWPMHLPYEPPQAVSHCATCTCGGVE